MYKSSLSLFKFHISNNNKKNTMISRTLVGLSATVFLTTETQAVNLDQFIRRTSLDSTATTSLTDVSTKESWNFALIALMIWQPLIFWFSLRFTEHMGRTDKNEDKGRLLPFFYRCRARAIRRRGRLQSLWWLELWRYIRLGRRWGCWRASSWEGTNDSKHC